MATTDKKTTFDKTKELAIIKASNELLEDVKRGLLERDNVDEGIILQLDNAKRENLIMAQTAYGASEQDVSGVQYHGPSVKEIKEYEKRLQKKGITDEQLHQKDISKNTVVSSSQKKTNKRVTGESVEKDEKPRRKRRTKNEKNDENNNLNTIKDVVKEVANEEKTVEIAEAEPVKLSDITINKKSDESYNIEDYDLSSIPSYIQYDMIPLPSKGECYKHKKSRVPVAYLTAADENIITAPNMYRDGKILDIILRRKILDKDFNVDELCTGDRDAILLWLRATAYGDDFPVIATNPADGKTYKSIIKLSDFKYNDFTLASDENGLFDYTTKSGDKIKFRYLTRSDELKLRDSLTENTTNKDIYDILVRCKELKGIIGDTYAVSNEDKGLIEEDIDEIVNIVGDDLKEDYEKSIPTFVTDQMKLFTYSVNGETDREYIKTYIENMRVAESMSYRRYYNDNKPSIDLSITVDIPESDGGGSFDTFLRIEDTIFVNY